MANAISARLGGAGAEAPAAAPAGAGLARGRSRLGPDGESHVGCLDVFCFCLPVGSLTGRRPAAVLPSPRPVESTTGPAQPVALAPSWDAGRPVRIRAPSADLGDEEGDGTMVSTHDAAQGNGPGPDSGGGTAAGS